MLKYENFRHTPTNQLLLVDLRMQIFVCVFCAACVAMDVKNVARRPRTFGRIERRPHAEA